MKEEQHYEFGKNWTRFLKVLDENRIFQAEKSLVEYLGRTDLTGLRFLDAGCGSGLFSLCARRLGAEVYSFDYDIHSVNCAKELRRRYFPDSLDEGTWTIEQGSVIDADYMSKFKDYDIVYSWGVLHHTGNMALAFEEIGKPVKTGGGGGILFISIYNDEGWKTRFWKRIKRAYNKTPRMFRFVFIFAYIIRYWLPEMSIAFIRHGNPFYWFINYKKSRGMSKIYDLYDWLGGYPFEVAAPGNVLDTFRSKGFELLKMRTTNGSGTNEFVFRKKP